MSIFDPETIENIRKLWGDDLFREEKTPAIQPKYRKHTVTSWVGEPVYGPMHWRYSTPIPWIHLVTAEKMGAAHQHVRVYLLARAMFDGLRCTYNRRPLKISREDSDYVRVCSQNFNGILRDLASAKLIQLEQSHGQKSIIRSFGRAGNVGRWKTCRGLWFPPISHISTELPAVSVMTYAFLTMHLARKSNHATVPKSLAGWTQSRREFNRGARALVDAGLIIREGCRDYTMPVLGGPNPDIAIKLGAVETVRIFEDYEHDA